MTEDEEYRRRHCVMISRPSNLGDPEHMTDFRILPDDLSGDFGGVDTNSGIHNKAAYNTLTAKDDQGEYWFDPLTVAELGYLTLTQDLSRTSTFQDSHRGILIRAATLFRTDVPLSEKLSAIATAFDDVGIRQ